MAMSLFLLIQAPTEQDDMAVRGIFTTLDKAKNHDKALSGRWVTGPQLGWYMVGEPGSADHHHIRSQHVNEEIQY